MPAIIKAEMREPRISRLLAVDNTGYVVHFVGTTEVVIIMLHKTRTQQSPFGRG